MTRKNAAVQLGGANTAGDSTGPRESTVFERAVEDAVLLAVKRGKPIPAALLALVRKQR